jgi:hypothetical protein
MATIESTQTIAISNNDTYLSLYEYLGKGSGGSNIGREVTAEAVKQGIEIKWRMLPKEMQKPEYTQVQLYPISFLDEYFATKPEMDLTPMVRRSALIQIYQRLEALEKNYADLIKLLPTTTIELTANDTQDDDLPF